MGLCSKCYKEHQTKNEQVDQSNPNKEKAAITAESISQAISSVQPMDTSTSDTTTADRSNGTTTCEEPTPSVSANSDAEREENGAEITDDTAASTSTDPSPGEKRNKPDGEDTVDELRPPQKNKKRCFQCNSKLELAIRQIGKCRCDYVFCQLHRLPEQHNCIYDERMAAMAWGDEVPEDILTYVVRTKETEVGLTTEELLDDFTTFFIAGHETTATMLSFLLLEAGRNPKIWKRLQDEVDTVIGQKSSIDFDDLGKLEYCSWVLKETLRIYPPSTMTFRELAKNHTVDGYSIPCGTVMVLSTFMSSRLPEFYEDPLDFRPERFDPETTKIPNYTYYPFSVGPRNCIGQNFAQIEAKILLAKFVQRFNIKIDMDQSFGFVETTTIRPTDGTRCTLTLRDVNNNNDLCASELCKL